MTEIEFLLRTARALLPAFRTQAMGLISRALDLTSDPRLRFLLTPALSALQRNEAKVARNWLDRACDYEQTRRMP